MSENNLTIPAALTIPGLAPVENQVDNGDNPVPAPEKEKEIDYEALYRESAKSVTELTAERDSLLKENEELRGARDAAITDSNKTKELNYTLARQLNLTQEVKRSPEEIMRDLFLTKGV